MIYTVCMRVNGRYVKTVEAASEEEAESIAWAEGDFGDLEDVDGDVVYFESENGTYYTNEG